MARVRAEVTRRSLGDRSGTPGDAISVPRTDDRAERILTRWQPAAARLPDKPRYVLGDFLSFDDGDFVDTAYQKLLRRPADATGRRDYLDALRSGHVSKVEILGLLRFSDEGRRQAVHVRGLPMSYKLHRWRHIRVAGWFLGMVMAIARLPRLALRLQSLEASAARESHELGHLLNDVERELGRAFDSDIDATRVLRQELARSVMSRVEAMRAARSDRDALRSDTEALRDRVEQLSDALRGSDDERESSRKEAIARLDAQEAMLVRLRDEAHRDQRSVRAMLDRLTIFLDAAARRTASVAANDTVGGERPSLAAQYASFEQTFRGERSEIKLRVAHYLDALAAAGIRPGDDAVLLDLGSGRGEWLEVLAERGYRGRGVDSNREMLAASRDRGHDVVEADALEYLHAQPNASIAAITSMHMVEHIPYRAVVELIDEALRVLRPGGLLILETPNPENILVGTCQFYLDPTHLHPVPPLLLQWTVQVRGFKNVIVDRLADHRGPPVMVPAPDDLPGAAQINQVVKWFTVPMDYAVVAEKPTTPV